MMKMSTFNSFKSVKKDKLRIRSSRQSIYNFTLLLSRMFVRFLPNKLMFLLKRFQYQCQINDLILTKVASGYQIHFPE